MQPQQYRLSPHARPFRLEVERDTDSINIKLLGEFDLSCKREFEAKLRDAVSRQPRRVRIDLRGLTLIDSTGLSMILEVESLSRRDGFDLSFRVGDGQVRRVLEQTGISGGLRLDDQPV
jgi:anti-anti-sigma factor